MKYIAKYGHWIFLVLLALEIWEIWLHQLEEVSIIRYILIAGWLACFFIFEVLLDKTEEV
jgi:hypothetical protein